MTSSAPPDSPDSGHAGFGEHAPAASFGVAPGQPTGTVLDGRLAELLGGKKIVMTGVTGFIGEVLLWKILTQLPDTKVALLVRPKGKRPAETRVRALLQKSIFASAREAAATPERPDGVANLLADRIEVIAGDLPDVPALPRDLDIVLHCAGDVSFDPPIDKAFSTNVLGTRALIERTIEACTGPDGTLERVPHYVHVSTAYTAGRRRGAIPEAAHDHDVDYLAETAQAMEMSETIEKQSRTPGQLAELRRAAERDHRKAGYLTTSRDTERRRLEWVAERLVEAGTERARSLGWTDVYTFAKAMAERAVEDLGSTIKVSIVRPAIVESALSQPYPGWIEGFKMAEPLIMAYGKGQMPEFPASPDSVIDIIPVDLVVNATLAVCATDPEVGRPEYFHLNSGARNPLTYSRIYQIIRAYFQEHPFEINGKNPELPEWDFPGAAAVDRKLRWYRTGVDAARGALRFLPRSRTTRELARRVDKASAELEFLERYLTLYGEYLQSELHFVDDHTLALHRSLDPADAADWAFDSGAYDWRHYMGEVHTPSVTAPVRRGEHRRSRQEKVARGAAPLPKATDVLAAFDLDGTMLATNVVETYLWARLPELGPAGRLGEVAALARRVPDYLVAESRDRGTFLRSFYRRYAGADLAALDRLVDTELDAQILGRLSPDALRRVEEHRAAGHTTVLITGVIRPLTRPLRRYFDVIVAADLETDDDGICTGFLTGPPMVGESRGAWLRHYAQLHGIDLDRSYAYADSHADEPMLSAVGRPVAVCPDLGLLRVADAQGWPMVEWTRVRPVVEDAEARLGRERRPVSPVLARRGSTVWR